MKESRPKTDNTASSPTFFKTQQPTNNSKEVKETQHQKKQQQKLFLALLLEAIERRSVKDFKNVLENEVKEPHLRLRKFIDDLTPANRLRKLPIQEAQPFLDYIFSLAINCYLDEKTNPHVKVPFFYWVIFTHQTEKFKQMVEEIDVDKAIAPTGVTPLIVAAELGYVEYAKILLVKGASFDSFASLIGPAFPVAARDGRLEMVKFLIASNSADINEKDIEDGMTPLLWAIENDDIEMVQELLEAKADPTIPARDGILPLYLALKNGSYDVVDLLLLHGADPYQKMQFENPSEEASVMDLMDDLPETIMQKLQRRNSFAY